MVLVVFEVDVKKEHMADYLAMAGKLKEQLEKARGFIRSERFASLTNEGKLLSMSVWENEEAVEEWRNEETHRLSQQSGRDSMFESFTITVASQIRSYSNTELTEAPDDSNKYFSNSRENMK